MGRFKMLWFAGVENARRASRDRLVAVAAIVALMMVVGAFALLS